MSLKRKHAGFEHATELIVRHKTPTPVMAELTDDVIGYTVK